MSILKLISFTAPSCPENLALDDAMLALANTDNPDAGATDRSETITLRFWEPDYTAVVMGTGDKHADVIDRAACASAGVGIFRRASGGGTVLHAPGVWCYSIIAPYRAIAGLTTIRNTFHATLTPIVESLCHLGYPAVYLPICDIALQPAGQPPRKLAGHAQSRKKFAVLVHGSLMAEMDSALMECCLKHPPREPDYRAGRPHAAFIATLKETRPLNEAHNGSNWDPDTVRRRFIDELTAAFQTAWHVEDIVHADRPDDAALARVGELCRTRFSRDEWTYKL